MSGAQVAVDGETVASIGAGFLMLVAVQHGDTEADAAALVGKVGGLRVFPDDDGRMNRSIRDMAGSILVVSQFTLAGNVTKGRRPSFTDAADPAVAEPMVQLIADSFDRHGIPTKTGCFGAMMEVSLINDGPVTFVIDVIDGAVR